MQLFYVALLILLESYNAVYYENEISVWKQDCIQPFPQKSEFASQKNLIACKLNNAMLLNRIQLKIEEIFIKKLKWLSKKQI